MGLHPTSVPAHRGELPSSAVSRRGRGAAVLDGALGNLEQSGRLGDRVAVHVDGDHRRALCRRELHQRAANHDRRFHSPGVIGHRSAVIVVEYHGRSDHVVAQTIPAGVDDDPVQPTLYGGIVAEGSAPRCAESIASCTASSASSAVWLRPRARW